MGLALYDTSDPLVGITEALREERHESRTRTPRPPRHPPKVRHARCDCGYGGYAKIPIREHNAFKDADLPITIPRQRPRSRITWALFVNEGVDLHHAGSSNGLPPPAPRRQTCRPPSLERQNAFRNPTTSTPRRRRSADDCSQQGNNVGDTEAAAAAAAEEIADLYDLGLLYDNKHVRGSGFGFDVLTRNAEEQPQYTVYFRRAAAPKSKSFGRTNANRFRKLQQDGSVAGGPAAHLGSSDGEELDLLEWCLDGFDTLSNPDVNSMLDMVSDSNDKFGVRSIDWVLLNNIMEED
ncbi:hypothetical protein MCOR28_008544 [Pyricularia oryzae]|nr:hypothetical protein MCOR28_008544 [Pyricularia oryzae]